MSRSWRHERDLARRGLDTLRTRGATYGDVRFVRRTTEDSLVKNGRIESVDRGETFGFGVRAIAGGGWGFAASQITTGAEIDRVAALAVEIAKASALTKLADPALSEVQPAVAEYATTVEVDPFGLAFEERIGLLVRAEELLRKQPGLRTTRARYAIQREEKLFLSTEGADIAQTLTDAVAGSPLRRPATASCRSAPTRTACGSRTAAAGSASAAGISLGTRRAWQKRREHSCPRRPARRTCARP